MSIRTNTNPRPLELPPEMRDILARNGMRGHIAGSSEGFVLLVQGHDSPLLSYPITEKQLQALTDWGTNYANRKCYTERQRTGGHGLARLSHRCRRIRAAWTAIPFAPPLGTLFPRLDTPAAGRFPPAAHRWQPLLPRRTDSAQPT